MLEDSHGEQDPQGRRVLGGHGMGCEKSCRMGLLRVTNPGLLCGVGRGAAGERSHPDCVVPTPQPLCDPDQPHGEEPGQEVDHPARRGGVGVGDGQAARVDVPPAPGGRWAQRRVRSECSGNAASSGLQGPRTGHTPPRGDSRPVTGQPPRHPRHCCCRCRWSCRCSSCRCCTGPRRWRSQSGVALRRAANRCRGRRGGEPRRGRSCFAVSKDMEAWRARP